MAASRYLTLFVLLACSMAAASSDTPRRIVSLNLCTDQLLMVLVPPERIASITWLSRTEGDPSLLPLAQRLHANRGSAEEVLALQPDLVLAGRYTTGTTRALLRKVGIPLIEVDAVNDWKGIRRVTREVATATGTEARAAALLRQMDAQLRHLEHHRFAAPLRVIGWSGAGNDVPGRDTLFNTILETAGAVNLAAAAGAGGSFDLEQVLRAQPQVLMRGATYGSKPALRNAVAQHRVLRAVPDLRTIEYPEAVYGCGVPRAADLAVELATQFTQLRAGQLP